jgi:hypothetical protein
MATVLAVVASCVLRAATATITVYDVGLGVEARGNMDRGTTESAGGEARSSTSGGAVELSPRLGAALREQSFDAAIGYYPGLRLTEPGEFLSILHRASLDLSWRASPRTRLTANAGGSYGTTDLLTQGAISSADSTSAPAQAVPRLTTLRYVSAAGTLQLAAPISKHVDATVAVSAFAEGGGDSGAEDALPLQKGGRAQGDVKWTATSRDVLDTAIEATVSTFSTGQQDRMLRAAQSWRHALSGSGFRTTGRSTVSRWDAWVTAGAALSEQRGDVAGRAVLATGEVGVNGKIHIPQIEGSTSVALTPVLDRITAEIYRRATVSASAWWRPWPDWTLRVGGSGGVAIEGPQHGARVAAGEARLTWNSTRTWEIGGGMRTFWQRQDLLPVGDQPPSRSTVQQWTGFVALTFRDRDRF